MEKIFCSICNNFTNHEILSVQEKEFIDKSGDAPGWTIKWEIVQCKGCDMLAGREVKTYEFDWDPRGEKYTEYVTLYPKRGDNILQIKNFLSLPSAIRSIYQESIDCYNNESNLLCAGGLRAILEAICKEFSILDGPIEENKSGALKTVRKNNLQGKIAGLFEKGLLTQSHASALHDHRFLGNDALHELKRPSKDELCIAIEIIEHTLESLFEFSGKAQRFRDIRTKPLIDDTKEKPIS